MKQSVLDTNYQNLEREEILRRIQARKEELAKEVLILCHHYQLDDVYRFGDLSGDSLKLSREAAAITDRKYIVFCGVHFMAEVAAILAAQNQVVLLPHLDAGCSMADMASRSSLEVAWKELQEGSGKKSADIIPVTYVNSSADVKAFVGENGGAVCTSSNGQRVLEWALEKGKLVIFFPDQHLGRNCADALHIAEEQVLLWHRGEPFGGCAKKKLAQAKVVLWDGYCDVHMRCFPEHVQAWRMKDPHACIIVHPECRNEVVRLADLSGSTEGIISAIEQSESGTHWIVGTEINLVKRLAAMHPDKQVDALAPACLCPTMCAVTPVYLLWILDNLAKGKIVNQITVEEQRAAQAKKALDRMLAI